MDLKPFKFDIDELINEFVEGESITLANMKKVWLSRKFTFIFEASPSTNLACFMQSLYAHSIGELKRLKNLVVDAKKEHIKVVSALVKSMLERNMFLFGFVDINEGSVTERVNELRDIQNARIQVLQRKLFANKRIEHFIHMDLGMELDIDLLKKISSDYAVAKELAIKEADEVVDVQNIKHIAENQRLIGDDAARTAGDWNVQKELFYEQTGFGQRRSEESQQEENEKGNQNSEKQENDENFGKELEQELLSLPYQ